MERKTKEMKNTHAFKLRIKHSCFSIFYGTTNKRKHILIYFLVCLFLGLITLRLTFELELGYKTSVVNVIPLLESNKNLHILENKGIVIVYSEAEKLEKKVEKFSNLILNRITNSSTKKICKWCLHPCTFVGSPDEIFVVKWMKAIVSALWYNTIRNRFDIVRGFTHNITEKYIQLAPKEYSKVYKSPNLYDYYTGSGKDIDTFILSWKNKPESTPTSLNVTYLRSILPLKKYYGCCSSPRIKSMGGLRKMSGSMSFSACMTECSGAIPDMNKTTIPTAQHLLTDYTRVEYRTGCDKVTYGQTDITKEKQEFANKNLLLDIITALDVIKYGGLISEGGYIYTANHQILFPLGCSYRPEEHIIKEHECPRPNITISKEVFVLAQKPLEFNYFHVFFEQLSRLSTFVSFLQQRPHVAIHVNSGAANSSALKFFMELYGLVNPVISGYVSADTIYMPHGGGCHNIHLPFAQIMAMRYHEYISKSVLNTPRSNTPIVILIKRSTRSLSNHGDVLSALQKLAERKNYELIIFDDTELPSMENTMILFYRAKLVVGSHGAGLSNIIFSQPGTTVVEVHCKDVRNIRLAILHLAQKLGMRYYATVTTRPDPLSDRCDVEGVLVDMKEFYEVLSFISTYL